MQGMPFKFSSQVAWIRRFVTTFELVMIVRPRTHLKPLRGDLELEEPSCNIRTRGRIALGQGNTYPIDLCCHTRHCSSTSIIMRSGMIIFLSILDKLLFYSYLEFENLKKVSAQVNKINQMILIDNIVWRTREGVGLWSGRPGVESRRHRFKAADDQSCILQTNLVSGIIVISGHVPRPIYACAPRVIMRRLPKQMFSKHSAKHVNYHILWHRSDEDDGSDDPDINCTKFQTCCKSLG